MRWGIDQVNALTEEEQAILESVKEDPTLSDVNLLVKIIDRLVSPKTNLAPVITGGIQQDRCIWCGKLLSEHADYLDHNALARMSCQGLKSGFQSKA